MENKLFRHLTKMLFLLCIALFLSLTVNAQGGELEYEWNEETSSYSVVGIGEYDSAELVIPSTYNGKPVTRIENKAFYDNMDITSLVLPESVVTIGEFAFHYCISLESVYLGGVTNIGHSAFYFCTSLDKIYFGENLTEIGDFAFYNCTDLDTLEIPNSVLTIGSSAFEYCDNLVRLTIGENVESIGPSAFEKCYKLVEVYSLTNKVDVSKNSTTCGNAGTYSYVIHYSLDEESILVWTEDNYVFALYNDKNYLVSQIGHEAELVLPDYFNGEEYEISRFAFSNRVSLSKITLGKGVVAIGNGAFNFCGIESIVVNEGVKSIGQLAFNDCHCLAYVELPSTLESLGVAAFQKCYKLESVAIPNGITVIKADTFFLCVKLKNIVFPSDLQEIEAEAFYGCQALTGVTLPGSLEKIGSLAFADCTVLKSVYIPVSVNAVSSNAFYGCASLTVYCEAEKMPNTWATDWNSGKNPVVWGASLELDNVFVFLGYSTNGSQICAGYSVDYNLLSAYEITKEVTVDFGIVFASYELLGGKAPLDSEGNEISLEQGRVIKMSLANKSYAFYDFILMDLTEELYDHSFVISGYAFNGEAVTYIQESGSETVTGKSYNQILAELEGEINSGEIFCPAL